MAQDFAHVLLVALARAIQAYFKLFERLLRDVTILLGPKAPAFLQPFHPAARDARIKKLDAARRNLADALEALGDLKADAERNKAELEEALQRLDDAKKKRASEAKQLAAIRSIAQSDIEAFRRLAGVPSPAKERLIGFLAGLMASLIAAGLWKLGEWILA